MPNTGTTIPRLGRRVNAMEVPKVSRLHLGPVMSSSLRVPGRQAACDSPVWFVAERRFVILLVLRAC
jgi:hypothetical protein